MDVYNENSNTKSKPQGCYASKVYINPYFNPNSYPAKSNQIVHEKNISMHVNPKFSNPVLQNKNTSNAKIFINPIFVKSLQGHASKEPFNVIQNNLSNNAHCNPPPPDTRVINTEANLPISNVKKSRYNLVRHRTLTVKENVEQKPCKTIKISKYKSVRLSDIKNNMTKEQNPTKSLYLNVKKAINSPQSSNSLAHSVHLNKFINRYKYTKYKTPSVSFNENKTLIKSKASLGSIKKNYKVKIISSKKMLKKNNIPCRLFKKFGKCMRNTHGNCEFSHDKKHVSMCRKFLKGICIDTHCLLSHDLTNNKMPTCYFYLKGMCTKTHCPYLHVKLNDNTKLCPDFLRGYCEKGKKCIYRHITIAGVTKKHSYNKYKKYEKIKAKRKTMCSEYKPTLTQSQLNSKKHEENLTEGRYYDDQGKWDDHIDDTSEVIKPTRCKLGNLPSFIQLRK